MIMKEKKLTDEAVVKAFEQCNTKGGTCEGCPYSYTVKDDIRCRMKQMRIDTLDLIHRLQSENEKLRNAKVITEAVDYCAEDLKKAQAEIEFLKKDNLANIDELKAEIERLTEERDYFQKSSDYHEGNQKELEKKNAELQKQVDKAWFEVGKMCMEERKDTAKDILKFAKPFMDIEEFRSVCAEVWGVEVE